jgi:hypothetical protein
MNHRPNRCDAIMTHTRIMACQTTASPIDRERFLGLTIAGLGTPSIWGAKRLGVP